MCNPLLSIMSIVFEGGRCKKVVCACFSRILQSRYVFIMINFSDEEKTSGDINLSTRPCTSMTGRSRNPSIRWRYFERSEWTYRSVERRTVQWQRSVSPPAPTQAAWIKTMSGIRRPSGTKWWCSSRVCGSRQRDQRDEAPRVGSANVRRIHGSKGRRGRSLELCVRTWLSFCWRSNVGWWFTIYFAYRYNGRWKW